MSLKVFTLISIFYSISTISTSVFATEAIDEEVFGFFTELEEDMPTLSLDTHRIVESFGPLVVSEIESQGISYHSFSQISSKNNLSKTIIVSMPSFNLAFSKKKIKSLSRSYSF